MGYSFRYKRQVIKPSEMIRNTFCLKAKLQTGALQRIDRSYNKNLSVAGQ